jgi:hypothetical protein
MKERLRRLAACLALCGLLSGILTVPVSAAGFQDVPSDYWAADAIEQCVTLGFFNGESATRFGVGHQMTRATFAVVLCRFFGWETTKPTQSAYQDIPANAWYAGAVEAAYAHGAITDQREVFRPTDPITREELAVMLMRSLGYGTIAGLAQDLYSPFKDVTTNVGYITMAYDLGIVSGVSADAFAPDRAATREQAAVILARLYHKLHGASPEIVGVVSQPEDVTGLDVAVIPAGKLAAAGEPSVSVTMKADAAAALVNAAHESGAQALMYVTGLTTALNGSADDVSTALAEAVSDGGYDGVCLDIPNVPGRNKAALTQLTKALRAALGSKTLYLVAEAPAWDGKTYAGYDYAALTSIVDRLVLRVAPYEKVSDGFVTAPLEPLEEVYYALAKLKSSADLNKVSLMLTTTPSAWSGGNRRAMSAQELQTLLERKGTDLHYSSRYACAYLTVSDAGGKDLSVWYLDRQAVEARLQLAEAFSVGQIFLTDVSAVSSDLLAGLQSTEQ